MENFQANASTQAAERQQIALSWAIVDDTTSATKKLHKVDSTNANKSDDDDKDKGLDYGAILGLFFLTQNQSLESYEEAISLRQQAINIESATMDKDNALFAKIKYDTLPKFQEHYKMHHTLWTDIEDYFTNGGIPQAHWQAETDTEYESAAAPANAQNADNNVAVSELQTAQQATSTQINTEQNSTNLLGQLIGNTLNQSAGIIQMLEGSINKMNHSS